jgi:hypothetical protein
MPKEVLVDNRKTAVLQHKKSVYQRAPFWITPHWYQALQKIIRS